MERRIDESVARILARLPSRLRESGLVEARSRRGALPICPSSITGGTSEYSAPSPNAASPSPTRRSDTWYLDELFVTIQVHLRT